MFWLYCHKTLEYNLLYGTVTRKTTKQNTGYKMFFFIWNADEIIYENSSEKKN